MIKVSIIGSGNAAQQLIAAFVKSPTIKLVQVFSRHPENIPDLPDSCIRIHNLNLLAEADLYLIVVSDSAIAAVSEQLPFKNRLVAHTSGSVAMTELDSNNRRSVFYPLQTFTKGKKVNFKTIPIALESENTDDYALLEQVAKAISDNPFPISSEQRKALHVAAVFVNNFTNHLYEIANKICSERQIPFEILKPLLLETAEKVMTLSPKEAQTGPAKRNDSNTIKSHLEFLTDENQKKIYTLLTQSIQKNEL